MRILCFHLNQVGDLMFSLPALRSIRDSFPDSHLTSVVRPGLAELLEATGLAHEVLTRDGGLNAAGVDLVRRVKQVRPDVAVVFSQSAECALLAWLSGARRRLGFINTSLGVLLTSRADFHHPPSTANNLRLVETLGGRVTRGDYSGLMVPSLEQKERADCLLKSHGINVGDRIAALSPGVSARRNIKRWSEEGFASVGRHLVERGLRPVMIGTEPTTAITDLCPDILDLGGRTSLGQAAAILARSALLVAVDSGILHLGAAAGTKVVGLYGPSNPEVTGPQGEGHVVLRTGASCSPCMKTTCSLDRVCMTGLRTEDVVVAIDSVLAGG